ncbi:transposable element Tcb2 transposase [Trichonephila clavipes]|nr:transposable element Tcb2 transposase [Trichonephila clavipes]
MERKVVCLLIVKPAFVFKDLPDTIPDPIISAESSHRHPMTTNMQSTKSGRWREMANNQSVRRHLDAFTRGRIIGKLEEGHSVTAEFGIAHSIISRLWRQFQTTGTAIRGFSSGRPRGTTPADDRYIVLQAADSGRNR